MRRSFDYKSESLGVEIGFSVQRNCRRKPLHLKRGIGEHTEKPSEGASSTEIVTTVVTLTRKALVSPDLVEIRDLTRSGENVRHVYKSYNIFVPS